MVLLLRTVPLPEYEAAPKGMQATMLKAAEAETDEEAKLWSGISCGLGGLGYPT